MVMVYSSARFFLINIVNYIQKLFRMSLNSLPDEIIAKITKKMPHSDRLNLLKTSKINEKIGRRYSLHCKYGGNMTLCILATSQPRSDGNTILLRTNNKHEMKTIESKDARLEDIVQYMDQFLSLETITLDGLPITADLINYLEKFQRMSLNSLPDEIIAKITKKMPHSDRVNIMSTNKRNEKIGRRYSLHCKYGGNMTLCILATSQPRSDGNTILLRINKNHEMKTIESKDARLEDIVQYMDQFISLETLTLDGLPITADLINYLEKFQRKIELLQIRDNRCVKLTKADFLKLTNCCYKLHMLNIKFSVPDRRVDENDRFTQKYLLSDEGVEDITSKLYIYAPNFKKEQLNDLTIDGTLLTDRLLLEIIPKYWPYMFSFTNCRTSFTLDAVITFIKLAEPVRTNIIYCLGGFIVESKTDALEKLTDLAAELNYVIRIYDDVSNIIDPSFLQCSVNLCEPNKPYYTSQIRFHILHN